MLTSFDDTTLLFLAGTLVLVWQSRKPLRHRGSHGWWRFFAWEAMLVLALLNRTLAGDQRLSLSLLSLSLLLVGAGLFSLLRQGQASGHQRTDHALYHWEKTTALVTSGIYRWIRHPMYASLLALNWGLYFRATSGLALIPALLASYFLLRTALADEQECIGYFGQDYVHYMTRSYRFIPWVL